MKKNDKKVTEIFSYEVVMLVHVIADSVENSQTILDEKGGIVTKREVKLLNSMSLFGEKETI